MLSKHLLRNFFQTSSWIGCSFDKAQRHNHDCCSKCLNLIMESRRWWFWLLVMNLNCTGCPWDPGPPLLSHCRGNHCSWGTAWCTPRTSAGRLRLEGPWAADLRGPRSLSHHQSPSPGAVLQSQRCSRDASPELGKARTAGVGAGESGEGGEGGAGASPCGGLCGPAVAGRAGAGLGPRWAALGSHTMDTQGCTLQAQVQGLAQGHTASWSRGARGSSLGSSQVSPCSAEAWLCSHKREALGVSSAWGDQSFG